VSQSFSVDRREVNSYDVEIALHAPI